VGTDLNIHPFKYRLKHYILSYFRRPHKYILQKKKSFLITLSIYTPNL